MSHSKGPWQYRSTDYAQSILDAEGTALIMWGPFGSIADMDEADWRLMAAAPDLLEALSKVLEDITTELDNGGQTPTDLQPMRAAILKATT
jgi:hypothetical protein